MGVGKNYSWECGGMKKIFLTPVVLFVAVFIVLCGLSISETSVMACSQKTTQDITGGACSIAELRNLEDSSADENSKFFGYHPRGEKDLRPVRIKQSDSKRTGDRCLFGMCLYKSLLGQD